MEKIKSEVYNHDLTTYLKIAGLAVLGVLALFLVTKTVNEAKTYTTIGENPSEMGRTISVKGHAEIKALPDVATFSWTTNEEGKTVQDAQDKSADKTNKAIAYLKAQGVKPEDISTGGFNTSEKYKSVPCPMSEGAQIAPCANPEVSGYITYQTVTVKIKSAQDNNQKLGQYIAELGKMGVKTTDVTYGFDDTTSLKLTAQQAAIYNARMNAEALAKTLGVKIGKVIGYNDMDYAAYGGAVEYDMKSISAVPSRAPIAPELPSGDRTINADVMVTYSIN